MNRSKITNQIALIVSAAALATLLAPTGALAGDAAAYITGQTIIVDGGVMACDPWPRDS